MCANKIEPGSLAEHLFTNYSLSDLQQLLAGESDALLKQQWKLPDTQFSKQLELAIAYVKQE